MAIIKEKEKVIMRKEEELREKTEEFEEEMEEKRKELEEQEHKLEEMKQQFEKKVSEEEERKRKKKEEKQQQKQQEERSAKERAEKEHHEKLRTMAGFLAKKGHLVKNWKTRWFKIEGAKILYYKQSNETQHKGEFELKNGGVVELPNTDGREHCFKISSHGGKEFIVSAPNNEEKQQWIEAIRFLANELQDRVAS